MVVMMAVVCRLAGGSADQVSSGGKGLFHLPEGVDRHVEVACCLGSTGGFQVRGPLAEFIGMAPGVGNPVGQQDPDFFKVIHDRPPG